MSSPPQNASEAAKYMKTMLLLGGRFAISDVVSQKLVQRLPHVDKARTARAAALGGLVMAPLIQKWIDYTTHLTTNGFLKGASKAKQTLWLIILDQTLFSTIATAAYFIALSFLQTGSLKRGLADMRAKLVPSVIDGWKFWPAVDLITFYFLPDRFKIPFMTLAGFLWGLYMATVANSDSKQSRALPPGGKKQLYGRRDENPNGNSDEIGNATHRLQAQ